jgi:hypothetical protein
MIDCSILNRFRGTGLIKRFGTLKVFDKEIEIKFTGNHLYGLWLALVLGIATMNVYLGLSVLVAYLVGESKGWGEWVGSLTRYEPWNEAMLQYNYKDEEGKTSPYIHQVSNFIIPEKIDGTFETRAKQYRHYATLALSLRGFYWWSLVYFTLAIFQVITYQEASIISILLGITFPIACEIGRRIKFTRTYDLKFIKLSFSQGWENQEVVYGLFQGIALWYTIIFLI